MDDSSLCYNYNNEKITIKISKDLNNQNWLVNRCQTSRCKHNKRKSLKKAQKKAPKTKPSLKVRLPIKIWDAMQEQNAQFRTPTTRTAGHRSSQSSAPPATLSMPSSPTSLRMMRHPIPTSKGRTSFADKMDPIVKVPKVILPPKTTFQRATNMPLIPGDIPPTKAPANDPEKNKTEESIVANSPKTLKFLLKSSSIESSMPIKHKLPITIFPHKGSYIKKPTNKENTRIQTTVEQETQTEKCLVVTEEEIHILEIVKNSGLSSDELQNQLVNYKKDKEKKNDNKAVIELEDDSEEDANDLYAKVMKHSTNNKFVLNKIAKIFQKSNSLSSKPSTTPHEPPSNSPSASTAPITAVGAPSECSKPSPTTAVGVPSECTMPSLATTIEAPSECTMPSPTTAVGAPSECTIPSPMTASVGAPSECTMPSPMTASVSAPSECTKPSPITASVARADTLKPALNPHNLEANDLQKGIAVSAMLLQMGLRIVRIEPQTQGTQTEENRENNKKRKLQSTTNETQTVNELRGHYEQNVQRAPVVPIRPGQEMPALMSQMQDVPVFQPHNPPRQQQPQQQRQQTQQYASEHIERPAQYYPHVSGVMAHQRVQNTATRNPHLSSIAALNPFEQNRNNNTSSTSQTPVQMQSPAQMYPTNQRRQSGLGQSHHSRVMSTHEANMHGSQQPCWGYTHYYDIQGYEYPQRHQ
ncbi:proteoglycan 4-like [Cydia fagiglandana]|uniref:proteoglycan 4-like n=1 Tax=Cydia fagiglandana TaxID=1458189 RepID=UPI002FEE1F57